MIREILNKLKSIIVPEKNDNAFVYYDKSIFSYFDNVRQYSINDNIDAINICTQDIVPKKIGKNIEYEKKEIHTVVQLKESIIKRLIINNKSIKLSTRSYLIKKFIFNKYKSTVIEKIDSDIFYLMSEMGRVTSSVYAQTSNNFPLLTISKFTTLESLLKKIEKSDDILLQLNGIGLKHIIVSKCFYEKLQKKIVNGNIVINNKTIIVQCLPTYLENSNPVCLILSSTLNKDETPGIVLIHKKPNIKINKDAFKSNNKIFVNYEQQYGVQKCGTNPEFYYLRFYQT